MPIGNVHWITSRSLYLDLDPIRSTQFEVPFDDRPGEIVDFLKSFALPIVEVRLPVPRRMPTRTRSAEDKETRVGRPLGLLDVAAMLTIGRLEVFGRQERACHITNFDTGFVKWRVRVSPNG